MCNDCCGAKATRKPWRGKGKRHIQRHLKKTPHPGEVVSVDQLESSIPGFIGQCIVASTVYVDHASDLSYVYHQTSMTSEETLKSKLAFEKFAASHGVNIKHYHADNGRFKDKLFSKSIEEKGQTISFCGVGAHHQNGIAEKRIGDLQRRATTLLLHAQRRWPDAIKTHIYGLKSDQQMIVGIMHQQTKMTHVQCQNTVTQQVCQKFKTNMISDVLHMYLERNYRIKRR
jgi:transposase InsO family protein